MIVRNFISVLVYTKALRKVRIISAFGILQHNT